MSEPRRITERYHLEKRVSAKETGNVFRANDTLSGQIVAVKLIDSDDVDERRDAFQAAARALQDIHHPALPRILDFGTTTAGSAFLVTEYLHGTSFETLAGAPPSRIVQLLLLVVDGLEALHAAGLAHRNLRLDNLLFVDGSATEEARILGLGSGALQPETSDGFQTDLQDFATLVAELFGVTAQQTAGRLLVNMPAAAVSGLKYPAALGSFLEDVLRGDPEGRVPNWDAVRRALRRTLTGDAPIPEAPAPEPQADETRPGVGTIRVPMAELRRKMDERAALDTGDGETRILRVEDLTPEPPAPPPAPQTPAAPPSRKPASGTVRISMAEMAAELAGLAAAQPEAPPEAKPAPDLSQDDTVARRPGPVPFPVPAPPPSPKTDTQELAAFRPKAPELPTQLLQPVKTAPPPPEPEPQAPLPPPPPPLHFPSPAPAPAAPPMPPPAMAAAPPAPPAPRAPTPRPQAARSKTPILLIAAGGGLGLLAVLAIGGFLLWKSRSAPPPPVKPAPVVQKPAPPPPVTPAPTPTPPPLNPQLQAAEGFLAANDMVSAKAAIEAIPPEQALSPEEQARVQAVLDAVNTAQTDQFAAALAKALSAGDPKLLKAAIDAIPADQLATLTPAAKRNLNKAKKILDLDSRLTRAEKEGGPLDIVRQASALLVEQPRNVRANQLRENAAAAIEAEADARAQEGQLDAALARLDPLQSAWPTRRGLAERIDKLRTERRADQEMEDVLANVARLEKADKTQEALQLLAGTRPTPKFAERFREAKARLETQAREADAHAPTVNLRGATANSLTFDKGQTLTVPLRITDDLAVRGVEGWARPEGGRYTQIPVRQISGADYEMEISPDVHQNKSVDIYLTATDGSGHKGSLGDAAHPIRIKRKGILSKIFGKKDG
jgi:hypothetical protein